MDEKGSRLVESSAWIERMAWRTVCMSLFVLGLVTFVFSGGRWIYAVLIVGGLVPGLFLMAREQGERHIEAQRRNLGAEPRHDDTLPEVSGPGLSGPHRPELGAPMATGYRHDPVPITGRSYDEDDLAEDGVPMPVVPDPRDLTPGTDNGRGNPPIRAY